jgi:hypothetical protein
MITNPETLATVVSALLVMIAGIVGLACLMVGNKRSHLEDAAVRPDPEPEDKPCPAIQEAQELAAVKNAEKARKRAEEAAEFLREGACADDAAMSFGYASVDSMRKALSRYGYRLNGQPKEVKING